MRVSEQTVELRTRLEEDTHKLIPASQTHLKRCKRSTCVLFVSSVCACVPVSLFVYHLAVLINRSNNVFALLIRVSALQSEHLNGQVNRQDSFHRFKNCVAPSLQNHQQLVLLISDQSCSFSFTQQNKRFQISSFCHGRHGTPSGAEAANIKDGDRSLARLDGSVHGTCLFVQLIISISSTQMTC